MIFRRRARAGGKHRGKSAKELRSLQQEQSTPAKVEPVEQYSHTVVPELEPEPELEPVVVAPAPVEVEEVKVEEPADPVKPKLTSALPVGYKKETDPTFLRPVEDQVPDELPTITPNTPYDVPSDDVSRKTYLLFMEADLASDAYRHPLQLLARRASLLDRITHLNDRIDKLTGDAIERESALEELKFEKHIEELEALPDLDEDESQRETIDELPGFVRKRDDLRNAVTLLARLETNRNILIKEYKELVEEFVGLLPHHVHDQLEHEIREHISHDLEVFTQVSSHTTSDGEWSGDSDATLEELEEFLKDLEEDEVGPWVNHKGDSLFHLE